MMQSILLVDDEADLRLLTKMFLENEGYTIFEASSGAGALEALDERLPDLLLLDISMPGLDGWDVLEQLRLDGRLEKMKVAMLSAHTKETVGRTATELGCSAFIAKPFRRNEFVAIVRNLLAGRERNGR